MMAMQEVNCEDKVCFLEFHFKKVCSIYQNNGTNDCSIPCSMTTCETEVYKNINCPIWTCVSKVTSTLSPLTSTNMPLPKQSTTIVMIVSLIINVILFTMIGIIVVMRIKSFRRRRHYQDPDFEFSALRESQNPIIRSHAQPIHESFSMGSLENADQIISLNDDTEPALLDMSASIQTQNDSTNVSINFKKFEEKKNKHRNKIV